MSESMPTAVTVEHEFAAAPGPVWVALSDPVTTRECLPGCTALEPADGRDLPAGSLAHLLAADDATRDARTVTPGERYDAAVGAAVAGVGVDIDVDVAVTERDYPDMAIEGDIGGDAVDAAMDATLTLEEREAGCVVTWRAEADVEGRLATYGRRAVESTVARVASDFFEAVEERLAARDGPENERAVKDPDWG
ncbi:carbon monoxide dehydrogenase subunit G [Halarchaeum rubridurum]|uniref:Carbon monoxide dehydrogenase subunit G n=1 Tax=Halarchaeum rubridurum TaxID=489911 RepID=A0A830FXQ4_9EURY|nr:SRPBCC domain-containing protein [Halarchaeum rubridurum]MBP1954043.1 carbon monoxide dehydrogenase subunit G [Halarchaeum rubridurum]GGM56873.1 hypothetical protein GCM10009017_03820 [Halarchaeum rubridurum]